MAIRVEHEMHGRRRGRNIGLGLVLVAFVGLIFGLTVVKVLSLGDATELQGFDHLMPAPTLPDPAATPPAAIPEASP